MRGSSHGVRGRCQLQVRPQTKGGEGGGVAGDICGGEEVSVMVVVEGGQGQGAAPTQTPDKVLLLLFQSINHSF